MGEFSLSHMLLLAGVLLLFFGPSKLPGLGKSMGEAIRGFKKGMEGDVTPEKPDQITAADSNETSSESVKEKDKDKA